jgi:TM2 domain-containing membrane protein YozV
LPFSEVEVMASLTPEQRVLFQSMYSREAKVRSTAFLLTLFLGGVGAHRFYLGQTGRGLLYVFFCWTFIPVLISLLELFVIGSRVDRHNRPIAEDLAARVKLLGAPAA